MSENTTPKTDRQSDTGATSERAFIGAIAAALMNGSDETVKRALDKITEPEIILTEPAAAEEDAGEESDAEEAEAEAEEEPCEEPEEPKASPAEAEEPIAPAQKQQPPQAERESAMTAASMAAVDFFMRGSSFSGSFLFAKDDVISS